MIQWIAAYGAALAVYLVLDLLWLGVLAREFYRTALGDLLLPQPNLAVAALFYVAYPAGALFFATQPGLAAESWSTTAMRAALLGLLAYGTYDLTNLATLRGFSPTVAAVDIVWGVAVTTAIALAGHAGAQFADRMS